MTDSSFTLYVDGACRGNPGIGGWGALIIDNTEQRREIYGGDLDTTNNRMELTAAIEGIKACPIDAPLNIYTDSSYVQKGITEWIKGWKAKNWKGVKNPDLWQQLDDVCQNRQISWHWIKGHAGHAGNERADQLANLGADAMDKKKLDQNMNNNTATTAEDDWLLSDPFGLGQEDEDSTALIEIEEATVEITEEPAIEDAQSTVATTITESAGIVDGLNAKIAKHVHITEATTTQNGERLFILDTETTGFYYQDGDRIIEVGAIEMVSRRLTGRSIHIYINPEKAVGESENIHGISDAFLKDKPKFKDIASVLYDYLKGTEIVAHNASFDMNFLDMEFERAGLGKLSNVCSVTDTLLLAKRKHPGQKNSLDMLVKRYDIPPRDRTFHGALLDAEILSDVYLAMTGGQVSLDIDAMSSEQEQQNSRNISQNQNIEVPLILPHQDEIDAHQQWVTQFNEKNQNPCLFSEKEMQ